MDRQSLLFRARVCYVHILVLLSLLVSGCGGTPAAATEAPAATQAPVGEPGATEAATEAASEAVVLSLLYPVPNSQEESFISSAVEQFKETYPEISVDLQLVPIESYRDTLVTRVQAGDAPDVAVVDYSNLYPYYQSGILLSIEQAEGFLDDDFLDDSVRSTLIFDGHYGVPWRRDSCSLAYQYLSIMAGSKHPQEAFKLMDFLAQSSLQEQAYKDLLWYPTRKSAYSSLGIGCSINEAIRLQDNVRDQVFKLVPENSKSLDPVLEGRFVEAGGATGVFENEALVAYGAAVANPVSFDEAQQQIDSTGLVMGALIINKVEEYPPGSYVLKCFKDNCALVSPDGSQIPFDLIISEELDVPVSVPRMAVVPGSKINCYWYYIFLRCSRVG